MMFVTRLIKTEEDYNNALARIEELFDADINTPEGDELELLVTLVEFYEKEMFPIEAPDPISAIKFRMEQMDLNNNDLIPFIGNKSKVSEVLSGKRALSLNMIRKLHEGLGIPADVLIAKINDKTSCSELMAHSVNFPFTEMFNRGWFKEFCNYNLNDAKEYKEEILTQFSRGFDIKTCSSYYNRQSDMIDNTIIDDILLAWRIRVMNVANKEQLPKWNKSVLTNSFLSELSKLSFLSEGPKLAKEYLNKAGIHLVIERHLKGTHLDGSATLMPDGSPLIALTLRYDRLDSFWFTLFHEIAHIKYHLTEKNTAFFDDMNKEMSKELEREADLFAKSMLIPDTIWEEASLSSKSKPSEIIQFAKKNRISAAIPAGRIRYETGNYKLFSNLLGSGSVRRMF